MSWAPPFGAHVGEVLALTDAHDIFILSDASCRTQLAAYKPPASFTCMPHVMSTFCARTSVTLHTHVVGSPFGAHVGEVLALTDAHDTFHRILSDASDRLYHSDARMTAPSLGRAVP